MLTGLLFLQERIKKEWEEEQRKEKEKEERKQKEIKEKEVILLLVELGFTVKRILVSHMLPQFVCMFIGSTKDKLRNSRISISGLTSL